MVDGVPLDLYFDDCFFLRLLFFLIPGYVSENFQAELFVRDKISTLQVLFLSFSFFFFLQECILCVCVSTWVLVSMYVYILLFLFLNFFFYYFSFPEVIDDS